MDPEVTDDPGTGGTDDPGTGGTDDPGTGGDDQVQFLKVNICSRERHRCL